ncbi:MAG TPA: hypothetical protein VGM81_05945 [Burkholderiaceae bacterium]|jgi:hypothetical protein
MAENDHGDTHVFGYDAKTTARNCVMAVNPICGSKYIREQTLAQGTVCPL